jgi:hypothetical protein
MLETTMGSFENWRYVINETAREKSYSRMPRTLHIHEENSGETYFWTSRRL